MALMDTIKKFIILEGDDIEEETENEVVEEKKVRSRKPEETNVPKKAKVVSINHNPITKIVISKLDSAANVKTIINNLKDKTPVVFSIARLDRNDAARVVDLVCGAAFAVDGKIQKVSNDIFLVTPFGVEIAGDVAAEMMGEDNFSWDI